MPIIVVTLLLSMICTGTSVFYISKALNSPYYTKNEVIKDITLGLYLLGLSTYLWIVLYYLIKLTP